VRRKLPPDCRYQLIFDDDVLSGSGLGIKTLAPLAGH